MLKRFPLFAAIILIVAVVAGTFTVFAQEPPSPQTECTLHNVPASVIIDKAIPFYAQPLLMYTPSGEYQATETVEIIQAAQVEEICFVYVKPTKSHYSGWVDNKVLGANGRAALVSASSALGTPQPTMSAQDGSAAAAVPTQAIISNGEGSLLVAGQSKVVPYGSFIGSWNGETRNPVLSLCTTDAGCSVNVRGDYRWYTYADGTKVPVDVLEEWIDSQVIYFDYATSVMNSDGEIVWTKAA
ncbi:MAG: hypothetical protein ABIM99_04150 [Candidatus Dojkabacteria bacterium]